MRCPPRHPCGLSTVDLGVKLPADHGTPAPSALGVPRADAGAEADRRPKGAKGPDGGQRPAKSQGWGNKQSATR